MNVKEIIKDYMAKGDHATENANMIFNPNGALFAVGGEGLAEDYLDEMKKAGHEDLVEAFDLGFVHIHDLSLGVFTPYCCGHSLPNLLAQGIKGGGSTAGPAKRLRTAVGQIVGYIGAASNEYAGAQAFNDIDILLAPYAFDHYCRLVGSGVGRGTATRLTEDEVHQCMQELVHGLNVNCRFGGQSPFSNVTLALTCPPDLEDQLAMVGGKPVLSEHCPTYGQMGIWQEMVANAILDVYLEGDFAEAGFSFPIPTINVTEDILDTKLFMKVCELAARFGTPYFQNFINGVSGMTKIEPEDVRSMCCRLSINQEQIRKHVGGIFGNGDQTGSLGVITLSLPMIAHAAKECEGNPKEVFFEALEKIMVQCQDQMEWRRGILNAQFDKGLYVMSKGNFAHKFDRFFSTIGFVGLWEAVIELTGEEVSFYEETGMQLAEEILKFMLEKCESFVEETGNLYNLEATPAESASYKLAKKALAIWPDIYHQGTQEAPYFTNSCHVPEFLQDDLDIVFKTQNRLQIIPNGGTVTHFYTGEDLTAEDVKTFVKTVCETKIPYFSVTAVYSVCPICGRIPGAHEYCPNEHTEEQLKEAGLL